MTASDAMLGFCTAVMTAAIPWAIFVSSSLAALNQWKRDEQKHQQERRQEEQAHRAKADSELSKVIRRIDRCPKCNEQGQPAQMPQT